MKKIFAGLISVFMLFGCSTNNTQNLNKELLNNAFSKNATLNNGVVKINFEVDGNELLKRASLDADIKFDMKSKQFSFAGVFDNKEVLLYIEKDISTIEIDGKKEVIKDLVFDDFVKNSSKKNQLIDKTKKELSDLDIFKGAKWQSEKMVIDIMGEKVDVTKVDAKLEKSVVKNSISSVVRFLFDKLEKSELDILKDQDIGRVKTIVDLALMMLVVDGATNVAYINEEGYVIANHVELNISLLGEKTNMNLYWEIEKYDSDILIEENIEVEDYIDAFDMHDLEEIGRAL